MRSLISELVVRVLGFASVKWTYKADASLPRRESIKKPRTRGFLSAPERTRTSTDHSVHKALNLVPGA